MKLMIWSVQGAQGTLRLQRWANILHLVKDRHIDLCGIQQYDPGFPLPEAATTAPQHNYKCYAAPMTEPRVAFLAKNSLVPQMLEVVYSPQGLVKAARNTLDLDSQPPPPPPDRGNQAFGTSIHTGSSRSSSSVTLAPSFTTHLYFQKASGASHTITPISVFIVKMASFCKNNKNKSAVEYLSINTHSTRV